MKLLPYQKSEIFDLIKKCDLDPKYFEWTMTQFKFSKSPKDIGQYVPADKIVYKGSDFYFLFGERVIETSHFSQYSPGEASYTETNFPGEWKGQLKQIEKWLVYLKRELSQEDKWKRVEDEVFEFKLGFYYNEGDFSEHETLEIQKAIDQIKIDISKIGLTNEQINKLSQILEHTTELTDKINKTDWNNLFIGTIISAMIQLNLTKENCQELWTIIRNMFNKLGIV